MIMTGSFSRFMFHSTRASVLFFLLLKECLYKKVILSFSK